MANTKITSRVIADDAVLTANIADDAVTSAKLDTNIAVAGTLGVTGETTLATHLNLGDSDIIKIGAGSDLQIYHDGSDSYIKDQGTGNLLIQGSDIYMGDGTNHFLTIRSSGNVSIGTTTASHPLTIAESADGTKIRLNRGGVSEWDFSIGNSSTLSGVGSGALEILPQNGGTANEFAIGTAGGTTALFHLTTSGATFSGSLSKGSGSFKIDHPLESKKDTHHLVHSFVEAPQADNIYRGVVVLENGTATINLDTVSGMSEGTYVLLNTNTSCFTSNETDWDAVKGSVSGNTLTINCQNSSSTATVSWLVIGERHDQHMKDTNWTDSNGKVIVEPKKT